MKVSPAGRDFIKLYERCILKAYPDPKTGGAPWTIGWGSTGRDIGPDTVWTQEQADARFDHDLSLVESDANNAIVVPVSQNQFDAFTSILYNVGHGSPTHDGIIRLKSGIPSTLLRKLNATDYDGCADEFLRWISPGSSVQVGLLRRRKAERRLFLGQV